MTQLKVYKKKTTEDLKEVVKNQLIRINFKDHIPLKWGFVLIKPITMSFMEAGIIKRLKLLISE